MPSVDQVTIRGIVTKSLPGTQFEITIQNGQKILAYLGGRLRKFNIQILLGDEVTVEMSPYDLTKGKIAFRH